MWSRQNKHTQPVYSTTQVDKLFCTILKIDGVSYTSSYWYFQQLFIEKTRLLYFNFFREKNRRFAEQGAALVGLISLGLEPKEKAVKEGSLLGSADE